MSLSFLKSFQLMDKIMESAINLQPTQQRFDDILDTTRRQLSNMAVSCSAEGELFSDIALVLTQFRKNNQQRKPRGTRILS